VSAGNGSPGCDGGRTQAALGVPGLPGIKGRQPAVAPAAGAIVLADGGLGGPGNATNHKGGDGGDVTIVPAYQEFKVNKKKRRVGPFIQALTISTYGNGADGFVNCKGVNPPDGGNGGHGASISGPQLANVTDSFNGGRGGDGKGAGAGGGPGRFFDAPPGPKGTITSSFELGAPGLPCPSHASMSVSPQSVDVGAIQVGATSQPRTVIIKNAGPDSAKVKEVKLTGDGRSEFRIVSDGCMETLDAGRSCPIDIEFTPTATGKADAVLSIMDDGTPDTFSVPLTGTGRQLYLYSFSGLSASWDSPLNSLGFQDPGDKLTLVAQGCGDTIRAFFEFTLMHTYPYLPPQSPDNNYWTLAGPFPIPGYEYLDINRNLVGEVDFALSIQNLESASPTVVMTPKVQGSIPNLTMLQGSASVTKTPVPQCPAGYPTPADYGLNLDSAAD
jgi:hypothetical protein